MAKGRPPFTCATILSSLAPEAMNAAMLLFCEYYEYIEVSLCLNHYFHIFINIMCFWHSEKLMSVFCCPTIVPYEGMYFLQTLIYKVYKEPDLGTQSVTVNENSPYKTLRSVLFTFGCLVGWLLAGWLDACLFRMIG